MKNPKLYAPTTKRRPDRIVREHQIADWRVFRLTPALEKAGYRVPGDVLVREGYVQKRTRQVIEEWR